MQALPIAFLALLLSGTVAAQGTGFDLRIIEVPHGVAALFRDEGRTILERRDGEHASVEVQSGLPTVQILPDHRREPDAAPELIPHGRVAAGRRGIARAWLADPTDRYGHAALGEGIAAGSLRVVADDGGAAEINLGRASVFEDLEPRLADLVGDGRDEVIVVRSYLDRGSALAIYRLAEGRLQVLAETPAIGQPNRWLNPIGVADFDGDGKPEVAVVVTPHVDGTLRIYGLDGKRLRIAAQASGFSNHVAGSTALGLSAIADLEGDGAADILLPDRTRRRLMAVSFAGGDMKVREAAAHPAPIATDIVQVTDGERAMLAYGLENGMLAVLTLPSGARVLAD